MKRYTIGLILLLIIVGCTPRPVEVEAPDWDLDRTLLQKRHPDMVLGYGVGQSLNPMRSRQMAQHNARNDLASILNTNLIENSETLYTEILESGNKYTAYVVIGVKKSK